MPSEAARLGPEPATANIPDHIKLALNYAEESSKRARWIAFLIQIAAVLVLASVWLETPNDWATLRLEAAQFAVRYLECEPQARYPIPIRDSFPENASEPLKNLSTEISHKTNNGFAPLSREELDIAYNCQANPLKPEEREEAKKYVSTWHLSLIQARKNVADLQQVMNARVLAVGVPVLGIVFDVNDLGLIAGITFSILLSWLFFTVRRQDKNVRHVFKMARESPIHIDGKSMLETTYKLMRMTQVLSIPPGIERDSRDMTLIRQLTRVPNVILWTAVVAQGIVLVEDLATMDRANALHPFVGRAETAISAYLFSYILYRTIRCFQQMRNSTADWVKAWNDYQRDSKLRVRLQKRKDKKVQTERRTSRRLETKAAPGIVGWWANYWRLPVGMVFVVVAILVHLIDEIPSDIHNVARQAWNSLLQGHLTDFLTLSSSHYFLPVAMLMMSGVILLVWWRKGKSISTARKYAWALPIMGLLDIAIHLLELTRKAQPTHFSRFMEGIFSSPLLVIVPLILLYLLRERPPNGSEQTDE
jgi:hypothetical protein